eukprot:Gregarina_sp_Poly_1__5415@NODE_2860_length_1623_cov_1873_071337_g1804_i0_p1_GENE_NODE_2860_length_1623_cov_1873_071337_g1804_i0NODE_2860_length_1623_cov_1873_071337_g1804_i0_p1_ORF_typecomplete_len343_score22_38PAN_1/PF00024_26/7_2e02PAN_1/PF00024_26/2_9e05PAN_4/PF14295_6/3_7e02PAN_4/PF14295_6/2_7e05PAN_4/PF14295_6/1_3e04RlaP/PF10127_9/0_28_NODE_2860_length_1623_cov_1873_071337_g1804_i03591387
MSVGTSATHFYAQFKTSFALFLTSMKGAINLSLFVVVTSLLTPDIENSLCTEVVSRTATNNEWCMRQCDTIVSSGQDLETSQDWQSSCMVATWHSVEGAPMPDNPCFTNWVYGYSEGVIASHGPAQVIDTPAMCQLLCQRNPECVNWLWAPSTRNCFFKSAAMVEAALEIVTEFPSPNMDVQFCNPQSDYMCSTPNFWNCKTCDGSRRCVWQSVRHLGGWKFCTTADPCESLMTTRVSPTPAHVTTSKHLDSCMKTTCVSPPPPLVTTAGHPGALKTTHVPPTPPHMTTAEQRGALKTTRVSLTPPHVTTAEHPGAMRTRVSPTLPHVAAAKHPVTRLKTVN